MTTDSVKEVRTMYTYNGTYKRFEINKVPNFYDCQLCHDSQNRKTHLTVPKRAENESARDVFEVVNGINGKNLSSYTITFNVDGQEKLSCYTTTSKDLYLPSLWTMSREDALTWGKNIANSPHHKKQRIISSIKKMVAVSRHESDYYYEDAAIVFFSLMDGLLPFIYGKSERRTSHGKREIEKAAERGFIGKKAAEVYLYYRDTLAHGDHIDSDEINSFEKDLTETLYLEMYNLLFRAIGHHPKIMEAISRFNNCDEHLGTDRSFKVI